MKILSAKPPFDVKKVKPNKLMLDHWAYRASKKLPVLPIFAIIHIEGSIQPPGCIQAWSINKATAKSQAKEIGGKTVMVTFKPPKTL